MPLLVGLVAADMQRGKIVVRRLTERLGDRLVKRRLVGFHCQAIVGTLLDDPLGNLPLAAGRIDRHQRAAELQHLQQLRNRRDQRYFPRPPPPSSTATWPRLS